MVQLLIQDTTATWRDVVDQLSAEMVAQLERAEELESAGAKAWECGQADSDALMLHLSIAMVIDQHHAGVRFAGVPIPAWVRHVEPWRNLGSTDDPEWLRRLEGPRYAAVGELGQVLIEGYQSAADGSIEWALRITGDAEDEMDADSARKLAAALVAAASFVESIG